MSAAVPLLLCLNAIADGCRSVPSGYARAMAKDRLLLALMLLMLLIAIGVATAVVLGAVEDCGPDGDCNLTSNPSGMIVTNP